MNNFKFFLASLLLAAAANAQNPIIITTAEQLLELPVSISNNIRLDNDIILNDTTNWQSWATNPPANSWTPRNLPVNITFDGNGHLIIGVYVNTDGTAGLFGENNFATIKNLGVIASYIKGGNNAGGLLGNNSNIGTISNSYFRGNVTGNSNVGGLLGSNNNESTISNSYFLGNVTGNSRVGGLLGHNNNRSTISNSYSSATGNSSGLLGYYDPYYGSTIRNSYYNKETSGQSDTGNGEGKTTAEMKTQSTYIGWNFATIWEIGLPTDNPLNNGLPYFKAQTPLWRAQIVGISDTTYTGSQIKPAFTATVDGVAKAAGVDFDYEYGENLIVGTGSVKITGKTTAFWGERMITFKINKADGDCEVEMANFVASGTPSNPVPSSETNGISNVTYSYKSLYDNSYPSISQRPANAGNYIVTATFPATANYLQCQATATFNITEGDCTPKELTVTWTADTVFTYNKMVQAPKPSVDEPGVELMRLNTHSAAGIYKGQDAALAMIKDETKKCSYALINNTKDYEIKKKDLKPYFAAPAALPDIESNTDTLWVPRAIFSDQTLLRQILDNLLSYDGFAQDTVTKEKDDATALRNTPAINLIYATPQTQQKILSKRVETTQTAVAIINTDNVTADNYALARRSITIMEILDEDEVSERVLCYRGNYCTELSAEVCAFIKGESVANCNNIRKSCQIDSDLCVNNMFISECNSIGGTVISVSCEEYVPVRQQSIAIGAFRAWQTMSGAVNVDLGYMPAEPITVKVYNLQGRLVASEQVNARVATIRFNAAGGIYVFKAGNRAVARMVK
ncbi:hypothetical protein R83H12_01378 [Fibrobacteria bacterium R8-3-H12]